MREETRYELYTKPRIQKRLNWLSGFFVGVMFTLLWTALAANL